MLATTTGVVIEMRAIVLMNICTLFGSNIFIHKQFSF
jgi:hypothetical protein